MDLLLLLIVALVILSLAGGAFISPLVFLLLIVVLLLFLGPYRHAWCAARLAGMRAACASSVVTARWQRPLPGCRSGSITSAPRRRGRRLRH